MPKYPNVHVKLVGEDGNAFAIMGRVTQAMKRAGLSKADIDAYRDEAMSGDYDHLLKTTIEYVETNEGLDGSADAL
jgi:hypothetical protein